MNREQPGKLYPVIIVDYDPAWPAIFEEEKRLLLQAVGPVISLEHIGSTAVPGIRAKPIIDILIKINETGDIESFTEKMKSAGFRFTRHPENPAPHLMFMKGYGPRGFEGQAFHVHVRYRGDWDEPYFRDLLKARSDLAREYERLKQDLERKYKTTGRPIPGERPGS